MKTPLLKYIGGASAAHPYPYQGYEIIRACSGYQAKLSEQDRTASIATFASFLKQLHSIDENTAWAMGVRPQGMGSQANMNKTISVLNERIDKIRGQEIVNINMSVLKDEIDSVKQLKLSPRENCFFYGDLDGRHLIFERKKLTEIIDWEDVGIANKAIDLSAV